VRDDDEARGVLTRKWVLPHFSGALSHAHYVTTERARSLPRWLSRSSGAQAARWRRGDQVASPGKHAQ